MPALVVGRLTDALNVAVAAVAWRWRHDDHGPSQHVGGAASAARIVTSCHTDRSDVAPRPEHATGKPRTDTVPHQLDRWMYRGGRPNRLASALNGVWKRAASAGLAPPQLSTLEVRGRKSGRVVSFPVVVVDHEAERYLVAMLGDQVNWVANVRSADGVAALRRGRREAVHLQELASDARAPVLQRYLQVAPGARAHMPVTVDSPPEDFERIAPRYPVFRVQPADAR